VDGDVEVEDPEGSAVALDSVTGWATDVLTVEFGIPLTTDGRYTVTLRGSDGIVDAHGNPLNDASDEVVYFTLDTAVPMLTVDTLVTNDATPELMGTVDGPDVAIEVTVDGSTYAATNHGDGSWTLADDTISPALADGTYDVALTATDLAGNVGTDTTTNELTIETEGPVTPEPVDDLVSISCGLVGYERRTGQFSVNLTVTNKSDKVISGPIWLVIDNISDSSITLANADGTTSDGKLYIDLSKHLNDGRLDPGESVRVRLYFYNPKRLRFTFAPSVRGVILW